MLRVGMEEGRIEIMFGNGGSWLCWDIFKYYNKATALLKVIEINQSSEYKRAC
jgi:hypothetical protein